MSLNSAYKEKYTIMKIQIDMIRPNSIAATIDPRSKTPIIASIPRSCISYASQKSFGSIMTFPITREVEIATWLVRKEGWN